MPENLFTFVLMGLVVVLGWIIVEDKYINPEQVHRTTDTVYVDKPFKVETIKPADSIIPETITIYQTRYQPIQSLELVGDTVKIYVDSTESDPINYNSRFLTNYPFAPKLLELELREDQVSFTGLTPDGRTQTASYPVNYSRQSYRMAPDGAGWVGLSSDRRGGWFGINLDFSHSLGVGSTLLLEDDEFKQGWYVKYNPSVQLKPGIDLEGNFWVTKNPFGALGINYQF